MTYNMIIKKKSIIHNLEIEIHGKQNSQTLSINETWRVALRDGNPQQVRDRGLNGYPWIKLMDFLHCLFVNERGRVWRYSCLQIPAHEGEVTQIP